MSDSIDRQAAIDAVCSICGNDCDKSKFVYNAPQDEQVIMCPEHYVLSTLPSAQPEPCDDDPRADVYYLAEKIGIHQLYAFVVQLRGEPEPCEDAVSRKAAIDAILGQPPEPHYPSWYAEQIKQLPPAQPEIIRCKDCKHWIPYDWMFSEVWQSKNIADYPEDEIGCDCCDMAMKANDFCSRGERRTE